jgi:hypothetical protein
LKRFNRSEAHYPSGPGLAVFQFADFTEIKAILFEFGLGQELPGYINAAKDAALQFPPDKETSACMPIRSRALAANEYEALHAVGILFIFVNRRTDVDGSMIVCLPTPARELDAISICLEMAARFFGGLPGGGELHLALFEKLKAAGN